MNDRGDIVGFIVDTTTGRSRQVLWRVKDGSPLRIETPNASSQWGIGTRQRLAWRYDGDAPQFQIEISRDGGNLWDFLRVVDNRAGPAQNFYWRVSGPATSRARFRVTAIGDNEAADVNDANIRISSPSIEVLWPARETRLRAGTTLRIFWKHNLGADKPIAIDVSEGGGGSIWRTVTETASTTGAVYSSFRWAPNVMPKNGARIRVRALDGTGVKAISEVFTVLPPSFAAIQTRRRTLNESAEVDR